MVWAHICRGSWFWERVNISSQGQQYITHNFFCISQEQQTILRFPDTFLHASCYLEIPPCYLHFFQKLLVHAGKPSKILPKKGNISLLHATTNCILCSSYYVLTNSSLYSYQNKVSHICLNANDYHHTLAFFRSDTLSFNSVFQMSFWLTAAAIHNASFSHPRRIILGETE